MARIKLMYIGDFGRTGFGTVSMGLLQTLAESGNYDILQLGINYNDTEPVDVPWKLVPAGYFFPNRGGFDQIDPYGMTKIDTYLQRFDPDVVFINNDIPVGEAYMSQRGKPTALAKHRSKKILYAPTDSWPFPKAFIKTIKAYDHFIAYSYFQYDMMVKADQSFADIDVMYHGVDNSVYFPIDKKVAKKRLMRIFRKYNAGKLLPDFMDKYLVYFVGTNQWRKDIPVLFQGFKSFRDNHEDAFLIPHTNSIPMSPDHGGWNLDNLRELVGLTGAVLFKNANIFTPEEMNVFYNAADVLAYPTRGEGFGLPSIEAMATKTPVIATEFGPQVELHDEGRGYFIDVMMYEPGNRLAITYYARPSPTSLAAQLEYVYSHPEEAAATAERAYEWSKRHTWPAKAAELDRIIQQCLLVSKEASPSRSIPERRKKTSSSARNAAVSTR